MSPVRSASRTVYRVRLAMTCVLLGALAFRQSPGLVVPDTKLDLTADPVGFLGRALHFWDAQGSLGQVQNQAYGYLFPIGPFFAGGGLLGLPDWVTQRLWFTTLLCVAFLGVVVLTERLAVGTPHVRLLAGLVYALSPRMLSELGPISAEILPMAVLPWILVPLVGGAAGGSPRRAAARSGLAVLCMGGVNAAASLAVLPLPALWLLTRSPGPRRRALIGWWSAAVGLATLWWAVPLVLLGRYSPPFLDFIEQADVTTSQTSLVEALRGTSHWLAYLVTGSGPSWNAGWLLVSNWLLVLDTVLLVAVGLAGLALRDMPHRRWVVSALVVGLALVTFGHVATVGSPAASLQRDWLDGALAPFRNVHKFEPLVRLPLVVGLAHLVGKAAAHLGPRASASGWRGLARGRVWTLRSLTLLVVCVAATAGAAAPLVANRIAPRGSYTALPGYWEEAADWLAQRDDEGSALLVPASSFGDYLWGKPNDEPLQALADSRWTVRSSIPFVSPGDIRMLDAVDRLLYSGRGSPGLAPYLARAGVRFLVVRNDLDYGAAGAVRPALVRQALHGSQGIVLASGFGPMLGEPGNLLVDRGLEPRRRAVEIYRVTGSADRVAAFPVDQASLVYGGPESLLPLEERGWLQGRPAVLAADRQEVRGLGRTIVTDGLRRREVHVGRIMENSSPTLTGTDVTRRSPPDYLPDGAGPYLTTVDYPGVAGVTASSSRGDPLATGGTRLDKAAAAVLDGDPHTAWVPDILSAGRDQWVDVRFTEPHRVGDVELRFTWAAHATGQRDVTVRTDAGAVTRAVQAGTEVERFALPDGPTAHVRVTWDAVKPTSRLADAGIAELHAAPLAGTERVVVPPAPVRTAGPVWYALDTAPGRRPGCVEVADRPRCAEGLARGGEEDATLRRRIDVGEPGRYQVDVSVRPAAGPDLEALVDQGAPVRVSASSRALADGYARPAAALDGERGTGWIAAALDETPYLDLAWDGPRTFSMVRLLTDRRLAASAPSQVTLTTAQGDRIDARMRPSGLVTFDPITTDNLRITVTGVATRVSYDPYQRVTAPLPAGLSEVTMYGAPDLTAATDPDRVVHLPCGSGPDVRVGDTTVPTQLDATVRQLLDGDRLTARTCADPVELPAGTVTVLAESADGFAPESVSLRPVGTTAPRAEPVTVQQRSWTATERTVRIGERAQDTLLVVRENQNDGWQATLNGQRLRPVTVDGWQQAFVVPAGLAGDVEIRFAPDRQYQLGLLVGLLAALALVALCFVPARRRPTPPGLAERWSVPVLLLAAGSLVLVGGWVAAAAAAAAIAVGRRHPRVVSHGLAPAAFLVAGGWLVLRPWGDPAGYAGADTWVQVLCVVAVAAVFAAPFTGRNPSLPRDPLPQPHGGAFGHGVAERGGQNGQRPRDRERQHPVPGEQRATQQVQDEHHDRLVPQEDPVGPLADPHAEPGRERTQRPGRPRAEHARHEEEDRDPGVEQVPGDQLAGGGGFEPPRSGDRGGGGEEQPERHPPAGPGSPGQGVEHGQP